MYLTKVDIIGMDRIKRLNLINSLTGIKPANLIGTISNNRITNLAIFSSVVHLGSHPALIGFVSRPSERVPRHTLHNILETECYTINHVHQSFVENAHYTSVKFDSLISEFEKCHLTEEYITDFKAPFVKESNLKLGMQFLETVPIRLNGTVLVIGEVRHIIVPDDSVDEEGHINLTTINSTGISGVNSYYKLDKIAQYPFARPEELPVFD